MAAASEPAPDSVMPNAANVPEATRGSQRFFWSALPAMMMGRVPSAVPAKASAMPPQAFDSSSVTTTMFMMAVSPAQPPYSSAM